jgi:octaprenyl-diphosphate synthase
MCEGEVIQICCRGDVTILEDAYFTIIHHKTAVLMAACCAAGAIAGGASDAEAEALALFGRELGMAFQIQDDVLDMIGDRSTLGKPVGTDLREGKVTLPLIYALERAAAPEREAIEEMVVRKSRVTSEDVARAVEIVHRHRGFAAARARARAFLREAVRALDPLPPSRGKEGLLYLAERIVDRVS